MFTSFVVLVSHCQSVVYVEIMTKYNVDKNCFSNFKTFRIWKFKLCVNQVKTIFKPKICSPLHLFSLKYLSIWRETRSPWWRVSHRKTILKIAQIREKHIKYNNIFHRGSDQAYGATHASGERENISFLGEKKFEASWCFPMNIWNLFRSIRDAFIWISQRETFHQSREFFHTKLLLRRNFMCRRNFTGIMTPTEYNKTELFSILLLEKGHHTSKAITTVQSCPWRDYSRARFEFHLIAMRTDKY